MSTIFPGSASVGQVYNNYTFDGTAWNINGIDLTENYLEESTASATYLTKASASNTYLTQTSASTTYAPISSIPSELGYVSSTSNLMITTTNQTYLSLTFTAPGTPIIVESFLHLYSFKAYGDSPLTTTFSLYNSGGTAILDPYAINEFNSDVASYSSTETEPMYMMARITPAAGSVTLQLRVKNTLDGNSEIYASTGYPAAFLRVTKV
jgi:hypothetical protein